MRNMLDTLGDLSVFDIVKIILISLTIACFLYAIYSAVTEKGRKLVYRRKSKFLVHSYRVFSELNITKRYVEQMRKRYEMLCPEDMKSLMSKTMSMCYIVWIGSILILILLLGIKPSLFNAALSVFTIGVLNHEYLEHKVGRMNMLLMRQMDKFLSDTRHSFYKHGMIDEAIADAAEKSGRIMKLNAVKIQNVLDSSDQETAIRRYSETVSNRFLRMFLSVVVYVSEFGDKMVNGVSILLLNIHTLKSDIYIDIMNRRDIDNKFSGMIFITLVPVFLLESIKSWVLSTTPNLSNFYNGTLGNVLVIVIFLLTVIIYVMINELKERNTVRIREHTLLKRISYLKTINRILSNFGEKNKDKLESQEDLLYRVGERLTAKQFLLKRMGYAVLLFGLCIMTTTTMHINNRRMLLTSNKLTTSKEAVIPDKMLQAVIDTVLEYMEIYKDKPVDREKLDTEIKEKGVFRSEIVRTSVADEIELRSERYRREYFHWYELVFGLAAAGMGYWFPYIMLLYRRKVLVLNMGHEVDQFQSIIMLVMNLDTTTVLKVLELMESFALIFKESIKSCINDYSSGDLDALVKLKIRERYEPFRRLVDNLIVADKIGIQRAFDEVAEERKVSQEMRNQEYRISIDKKVIAGTIMSSLPAVITLLFYFVVPFAVDALSGLKDYDSIMSSFR